MSFRESLSVWSRVAAFSFGGPAGQIAVMHRILVEEKKWISEARFLHALNYCMLLPGPEAQQLATYIGWLLRGYGGGFLAGGLFILPGFVSILALSIVYALYRNAFLLETLFFGLKPAVVAIVLAALVKIAAKALKTRSMYAIAGISFLALAMFDIPFPFVIVGAAAIGLVGGAFFPSQFDVVRGHNASTDSAQDLISRFHSEPAIPPIKKSVAILGIFLTAWLAPVAALSFFFGDANVFTEIGVFFSKAAVLTFGGAYGMLAYLAQQAVHHFHWLQANEMMDGLGMAETTPGPLIQVTQFVGFMGAYGRALQDGTLSPITAGILASVLTTWATYVPCFLWIFLGAPYIEFLRGYKKLTYALSSITAAVVGVILNLALWFSLHVLFKETWRWEPGPLKVTLPVIASVQVVSLLLTIAACVMVLRLKWGLFKTILGSILLATAVTLLR